MLNHLSWSISFTDVVQLVPCPDAPVHTCPSYIPHSGHGVLLFSEHAMMVFDQNLSRFYPTGGRLSYTADWRPTPPLVATVERAASRSRCPNRCDQVG